jgi:hypothetical protein
MERDMLVRLVYFQDASHSIEAFFFFFGGIYLRDECKFTCIFEARCIV